MNSRRLVLAVDVGGTKTLLGLVDDTGEVVAHRHLSTKSDTASQDDLGRVLQAATAFASEHRRLGAVVGVGAGFPEYVGLEGQLLSREVVSWDRQPGPAFSEAFARSGLVDLPVRIDSDVRLGARGEAWVGAGQGLRSFLYISLGTGLSATLVIEGTPWPGSRGKAIALGEWPAPAVPHEPQCKNLERFASGAGIAERHHRLAGGSLTTKEITQLPTASAQHILSSAGKALGTAIASLVHMLDPQAVILGGGLGSGKSALHEAMSSAYLARGGEPQLLRAALGARSGLLGAAKLAWTAAAG